MKNISLDTTIARIHPKEDNSLVLRNCHPHTCIFTLCCNSTTTNIDISYLPINKYTCLYFLRNCVISPQLPKPPLLHHFCTTPTLPTAQIAVNIYHTSSVIYLDACVWSGHDRRCNHCTMTFHTYFTFTTSLVMFKLRLP